MPTGTPKHDAVWVRQLADELGSRGHPARRLLREIGLDRRRLDGEGARIPFGLHAAFFELAATQTGDSCLGLHFGKTRDVRDAGLLGYVGLASPTVVDGLKNLWRYRRVFSDAVEIDVSKLASEGRFGWWFHGVSADTARQAIEFAASNHIRAIREATGRHIVPLSLSFAHGRSDGAAAFESYFGCPVRFGADGNTVVFRQPDLALPLATADDRLLTILRRYCEDVLARRPADPPTLVEQVERLVADRLTNGETAMPRVAAELGLSPRTLSRRLAALGTSYNAIIDELRRELAARYLNDTRLSLCEIAFLLGYTEVSTFNHAFRRWTGTTPTAFRTVGAP